jgi:hypothetical protein
MMVWVVWVAALAGTLFLSSQLSRTFPSTQWLTYSDILRGSAMSPHQHDYPKVPDATGLRSKDRRKEHVRIVYKSLLLMSDAL